MFNLSYLRLHNLANLLNNDLDDNSNMKINDGNSYNAIYGIFTDNSGKVMGNSKVI